MTERQGLRCPFAADGHREDEDDKDETVGSAAEVFQKINMSEKSSLLNPQKGPSILSSQGEPEARSQFNDSDRRDGIHQDKQHRVRQAESVFRNTSDTIEQVK